MIDIELTRENVFIVATNPIPEGHHSGLMSGYSAKLEVDGIEYTITGLSSGIRGINVPCTITVTDGVARITI